MKIKDVIVEQGFLRSVGRELGRRVTMSPSNKAELDSLETQLEKMMPDVNLNQLQKVSPEILKNYKAMLGRLDDDSKKPIALAQAVEPYYPELAKQIMIAQQKEKQGKEKQGKEKQGKDKIPPAPTVRQPITTSAGVEVVSTRPQIHLRYKKQDFFLKTDPSGVETFVNMAGKKVPDQAQEFLMRQLQEL